MELPYRKNGLAEADGSPSREALRLIVEVFRDGHRLATDLRSTASTLTPSQLQIELEAIEQSMLSRISTICENYRLQDPILIPRN